MSDRTTNPVVCLQSLVGDARVDPSVVEDRPRRIVQRPNRIVDSRHRVGGTVKPKSRLMHQCHCLSFLNEIFNGDVILGLISIREKWGHRVPTSRGFKILSKTKG